MSTFDLMRSFKKWAGSGKPVNHINEFSTSMKYQNHHPFCFIIKRAIGRGLTYANIKRLGT